MGLHRRPRPKTTRTLTAAVTVALLAPAGLLMASSGTAPMAAGAVATVTVDYLAPAYATAGEAVPAVAEVHADASVTAAAFGVAVRDSAGHHLDFPQAVVNVHLTTAVFQYESGRRAFAAGTYTMFPSWKDDAGVWHPLHRVVLTVGDGMLPSSPSAAPTTSAPTTAAPSQTPTASPAPTAGPTSPTPTPSTPTGPPSSSSPTGAAQPSWAPTGNRTPTFDDEFNGASVDTSKWTEGWGTQAGTSPPVNSDESECYSSSQVSESGGYLRLTAAPLTASQRTGPCAGKAYASGIVTTDPSVLGAGRGFQQAYGAFEARIYIPADSSGTACANWPAWWLDGQQWPQDGEVDVYECLSGQGAWHLHSDSAGGAADGPGGYPSGNLTGWHTFGVEWTAGSATFYYDGKDVGSHTYTVSAPNYLILNNATGAYGGASAADTVLIDWVRAWK